MAYMNRRLSKIRSLHCRHWMLYFELYCTSFLHVVYILQLSLTDSTLEWNKTISMRFTLLTSKTLLLKMPVSMKSKLLIGWERQPSAELWPLSRNLPRSPNLSKTSPLPLDQPKPSKLWLQVSFFDHVIISSNDSIGPYDLLFSLKLYVICRYMKKS